MASLPLPPQQKKLKIQVAHQNENQKFKCLLEKKVKNIFFSMGQRLPLFPPPSSHFWRGEMGGNIGL